MSDDFSASDLAANAAAVFHPAADADDNNGSYAPPCLEVGGVLVFAYVRNGILVVSLDYDGTDIGAGPGRDHGHLRVARPLQRPKTEEDTRAEQLVAAILADLASEEDGELFPHSQQPIGE